VNETLFYRLRLYFSALVGIAALVVLSWSYFHGGVSSHHLFYRADMPAISNWWGAILLPSLTWFLLGRIRKRFVDLPIGKPGTLNFRARITVGFAGSLLFGLLLSVTFLLGYDGITANLFFGLLVLALFLPVFRGECMLGFVFGMAPAFGPVLPILVGSMIAALSALTYYYIRPVLRWVWAFSRRK
jgi:hypothetical protein